MSVARRPAFPTDGGPVDDFQVSPLNCTLYKVTKRGIREIYLVLTKRELIGTDGQWPLLCVVFLIPS